MGVVFVTRRLPVDAVAHLGTCATVRVFEAERAPTDDELARGAADATGLVTLLSERVDDALLDRAPQLKIVANVAVGYDNIDEAACARRGVWVTNTPDVLTDATADLAWTLVLAVARRVREGERLLRSGGFEGWSPTLLLGRELRGRTLGIFGRGRIGRAVEARARAFGMEVIHTSRNSGVPFDELLARSDVLSIHCPLTDETHHAFDAAALSRMKPRAILVNTARGPIVDEAALVDALDAGRLFGAGLDVFENEPSVHPGLLRRDDVVLLPHLGSATEHTRQRMAEIALDNVLAVLRGEAPPNPVNRP